MIALIALARRFLAASTFARCNASAGVLIDRLVDLAGPSPCDRPFISTAARLETSDAAGAKPRGRPVGAQAATAATSGKKRSSMGGVAWTAAR